MREVTFGNGNLRFLLVSWPFFFYFFNSVWPQLFSSLGHVSPFFLCVCVCVWVKIVPLSLCLAEEPHFVNCDDCNFKAECCSSTCHSECIAQHAGQGKTSKTKTTFWLHFLILLCFVDPKKDFLHLPHQQQTIIKGLKAFLFSPHFSYYLFDFLLYIYIYI